jgi:uncharacterized protein YqjF (DUF2071 family)
MLLGTIHGVIDRRMLINYRVDPVVLQRLLPSPFRPKLAHGMGVAGICLIRLKEIRPHPVPALLGLTSENAAHRIAVEWDEQGERKEGVYIPRRDTSSQVVMLVGGTMFPGVHQHAQFQVRESERDFQVRLESDDGQTRLAVQAHTASHLPETSIFTSLDEVSDFFEQGKRGYSVTREPGKLDCLELRCSNWKVEPLDVTSVQSSFFEDSERFPPGSAEFDCALLMRAIAHEWQAREPFCCAA